MTKNMSDTSRARDVQGQEEPLPLIDQVALEIAWEKDLGEPGASIMNSFPTGQIKPLSHQPFSGEHSDEYNAFRSALRTAAENFGKRGEYAEYEWLDEVPRTWMCVELVDALHQHGYAITKRLSEKRAKSDAATGASIPESSSLEGTNQ